MSKGVLTSKGMSTSQGIVNVRRYLLHQKVCQCKAVHQHQKVFSTSKGV